MAKNKQPGSGADASKCTEELGDWEVVNKPKESESSGASSEFVVVPPKAAPAPVKFEIVASVIRPVTSSDSSFLFITNMRRPVIQTSTSGDKVESTEDNSNRNVEASGECASPLDDEID